MVKPGEIQKFKVLRKTDIGYLLITKDQEEVFLHNNETNFNKIYEGMSLDAFLFYDNKGRLAATLYEPIITKDQTSWLEVVGQNDKLGVFLNNNINKDILFSKDELPRSKTLWPQKGDYMYVRLVVNKNFLCKPSFPRPIVLEEYEQGDLVVARVQIITDKGITLLTENLTPIFVELQHLRKAYRLGENVEVTINYKHNEYYSGQLIAQKQNQMIDDAEQILSYLKQTKSLHLTSDSTPEEIQQVFNMSKKAFKRALGTLYKQQLINFIDGKTVLVGEKND